MITKIIKAEKIPSISSFRPILPCPGIGINKIIIIEVLAKNT